MMKPFAKICISIGTLIFGLGIACLVLWASPAAHFSPATVTITSGTTVNQAAEMLEAKDVIIFSELVSIPMQLRGQSVIAGEYKFATAQSPKQLADRLATGEFGIRQGKLVIPEGLTREEIADLVNQEFTEISKKDFLQASAGLEGYLFPDTYEFGSDTAAETIVNRLRENFQKKTKDLQEPVKSFPHSFGEVVKMASLVQKEAADYQIRRRIAGVLWRRLEADRPLQADAVFDYFLGKNTYELTAEDLQMNSPYNLYENTGLPPTPIANPGLQALQATINPADGESMYYLTGDDGEFYFAETLEEHKENKLRYME